MDTSIFLARLVGPVMAIMGLFVLLNPAALRAAAREIIASDALLLISGVITLPVGLAIVNTHNLWVADWRVILTLLGWITVFAGAARLILPAAMKSLGQRMIDMPLLTAVPGVLMAALGGYLSYAGYLG